jgi:hypothetical protein
VARHPLVPGDGALSLGPQLQRGTPTPGDGEQVARDAAAVDHHLLDASVAQRLERRDPASVEDLRTEQLAHGGTRVRRRQDDRALARGHAVTLAVRAHGAGEHHAGEVVAGEGDEPLVRPGRDDDLACTHVPQPRAPLVEHDEAVVVIADRRRPGQHPQLVERPDVRRVARAGEDHAGAGPRRGLGGRAPGGAGAGDEHVAVSVHPVVAAWVSRAVERPAHRQRGRDEPLAKPDARRLHHRLAVGADERAGLLGAGGHDPARAAVADRPRHDVHARGEQRGGERVAGEARQGDAVEREAQRPRAVDRAPALGEAPPAHERSWVTVSRTTSNQRRHPLE